MCFHSASTSLPLTLANSLPFVHLHLSLLSPSFSISPSPVLNRTLLHLYRIKPRAQIKAQHTDTQHRPSHTLVHSPKAMSVTPPSPSIRTHLKLVLISIAVNTHTDFCTGSEMQIKKNKYSGFDSSKASCRKSTGIGARGEKKKKCYLLITTLKARNTTGYIIWSGAAAILEGKGFG